MAPLRRCAPLRVLYGPADPVRSTGYGLVPVFKFSLYQPRGMSKAGRKLSGRELSGGEHVRRETHRLH